MTHLGNIFKKLPASGDRKPTVTHSISTDLMLTSLAAVVRTDSIDFSVSELIFN